MKALEIMKLAYIYLFSAIGLILIIIGSVKLINLGLKTFIFKQADVFYYPKIYPVDEKLDLSEIAKREEEQKKADEINRISQRQREMANSFALLIVGLPLFIYHWGLALKYNFNRQ